ncbi:hypothetical protein BTM25_22430 [Actinomadura rubteroloni]|uniref:Beta-lactamase n=1 Tax=Actinomadura rubteroloni TaxID=1926885 RepID=A0A2P4URY8_9ACTN|nr:serine hydrolase [Actinomadura rubteroloni]POM27821.1 hypothetical protein BTM25_22430 [Actinomadura rubteroloni]
MSPARRDALAALVLASVSVAASAGGAPSVPPARSARPRALPDRAAPRPRPPVTPTAEPTAMAFRARRQALRRTLDRYAAAHPQPFTAAVREPDTGFSFTYNAALRPVTASVVKVEIVIAAMLRAQRRHRTLTATERALAGRAVRHSDNVAATELWHGIGGTSGLAAAGRVLGLRHTVPGPDDYWGSTVTGAADQIRVLTALTSADGPLTSEHRHLLLDLMARVAPEQAWGISAAAGDGDEVALKNGWLPRKPDGGLWTVNSIGRLRRDGRDRLVAVLTTRHTSMAAGIAMAEHVAATVARHPAR